MQEILVTAEELVKHLGDPGWIIFDARHDLMDVEKGRRAYAAGHIPGAYFLHVDEDLSGAKTGRNGRHPLPDLEAFTAKMNACGLRPESQVVAYDDLSGNFAVRLWWLLRWLGHEYVALLDGGFPQWQKEGRPVTDEAPPRREGSFIPRPRLGATVDKHFVEQFREDPSIRLVDARAPDRFKGLQEPIDPVAGHVPGAVNRFWQKNLLPDGRFKKPDDLRRELTEFFGDISPAQAVHMCGSGVTACHNIFALELAGLPSGRLYPGSWSEWCADRELPVATN